jgi:hyperosmotically inducible protein
VVRAAQRGHYSTAGVASNSVPRDESRTIGASFQGSSQFMGRIRQIAALLAASMLVGCSAMMVGGGSSSGSAPLGTDHRSSSQIAADSAVEQAVSAAFAADNAIAADQIDISARDGRVTLKGSINGFDARDRAVAIARTASGVTTVDNQLKVRTN